jgi:actin-related protein
MKEALKILMAKEKKEKEEKKVKEKKEKEEQRMKEKKEKEEQKVKEKREKEEKKAKEKKKKEEQKVKQEANVILKHYFRKFPGPYCKEEYPKVLDKKFVDNSWIQLNKLVGQVAEKNMTKNELRLARALKIFKDEIINDIMDERIKLHNAKKWDDHLSFGYLHDMTVASLLSGKCRYYEGMLGDVTTPSLLSGEYRKGLMPNPREAYAIGRMWECDILKKKKLARRYSKGLRTRNKGRQLAWNNNQRPVEREISYDATKVPFVGA